MHIDNVLAGKRQEDFNNINAFDSVSDTKKRSERPSILKQKEMKYQANNVIKEDMLERQS
jgi:hypothetical protein